MNEREVLCDNSSKIQGENHHQINDIITQKGPKLDKISQSKPKDDDSDQDCSEDLMTESYGEISLEQELKNRNSEHNSGNSSHIHGDCDKPPVTHLEGVSDENSEQDEDVMTGSYGEISLDRELLNCDKSDSQGSSKDENLSEEIHTENLYGALQKKRPDSLILTQTSLTANNDEIGPNQVHKSQQTSIGQLASGNFYPGLNSDGMVPCTGNANDESDSSGLSDLQGTLVVDGNMVTFVAEDLQEKIKMSSPLSCWGEPPFSGSRSSTPSLYRQALQPSQHIIDPDILVDLEAYAKKVATCIDTMLENLSGTLQSISSLTVDCMETYESSVCKTCDAVDINIKSVYQLMAKCEELSNSMNPIYKISSDVKHLKKMIDQLEHVVEHKS